MFWSFKAPTVTSLVEEAGTNWGGLCQPKSLRASASEPRFLVRREARRQR